MRLFAGIPLAAAVIDELSAISVRLRSNEDGLRWSMPESWHITLQFLGNTGQEAYECIVARLGELRSPAVPIQLEGLGLFERPGVLFVGIALTSELWALQQCVTAATRRCGFVPETRPYHPHVTLARSKSKGRAPGLLALKSRSHRPPIFTSFLAGEFVLYESVARPTGSHYESRERFRLNRE